MSKPLRVGVCSLISIKGGWSHEGLTRLFGFIAEHADPQDVEFH
ncbi:MAG: hypothetical protein WA872_14730 [Candidatus Sulfotelmatobacter sp.]